MGVLRLAFESAIATLVVLGDTGEAAIFCWELSATCADIVPENRKHNKTVKVLERKRWCIRGAFYDDRIKNCLHA